MKKIILFSLGMAFFSILHAQTTKKAQITGALVAPWLKGDLCINYWYNQNKIHKCHYIQAGKDYVFDNIPKRVGHIKVTRIFDKDCILKNGKKKYRRLKGRFNLRKPLTVLNLTYDHSGIYKYYVIPPKEAESIYGYPRKNASIHFRQAAISDPTAFS